MTKQYLAPPLPPSTFLLDKAKTYFRFKVQAARDKARQETGDLKQQAKESIDRIDQIRQDTARSLGTSVDQLDRKIEDKAAEAKKSVSGWFGGK